MLEKHGRKITPIDILLLTYNGIENTKECIAALYKHTTNFHLTVLDNASTDGTVEYLDDLSDKKDNVTVSFREINLGVIEGRNEVYKVCERASKYQGKEIEYVMFLDNDQIVQENWDRVYLRALKVNGDHAWRHDNYDIVGAEAWQMDKSYYPKRRCRHYSHMEFDYVGCGGMMIRQEVIEDIGLFDTRFSPMYFEDPDFCWRALAAGYNIGWRPNMIFHKPHKLLTKEPERTKHFMRSLSQFRKKHFNTPLPKLKNKIGRDNIRITF